ncbi:MAG TPA: MmcQ/YjbR family DNA-binding protein [Hymenobacter sp.]|jgi:predicted DNA-binding protein (MmcQ/YjbR family)
MTIEDLQALCLRLPGTTEDLKWGVHLCFSVGGNMYLGTSPDAVPSTASFIAPPEELETLLESPGFSPNKHLGRYGWVTLDNIARLGPAQWKRYLGHFYETVVAKLPRKVARTL